jgi:hypothetical protein
MSNRLLPLCVFLLSSQLFTTKAQAANACLERATDNEILSELSRRLGHGGGGGDPIIVDSAVDLSCVTKLAQKYPYQPSQDLLVSWAGQCRTNVDERCLLISSSASTDCIDELSRLYPYQPSAGTLEAFGAACLRKRFSCRGL